MTETIRKFRAVFKLHHRQAWYHKYTALGVVASWGFRLIITVLLYAGIYHLVQKPSVKGVTLSVAISSMILYCLYSCFGGRELFRTVNDEYATGIMGIWLNKPLPYLGLKMTEVLGKNIPAAVGMLIVAIVLFFYSDLPQQTDHLALRLACALPLLIGGVAISYLTYALIGLASIWLEDARAVNMIYDKFIMIFGGIYVPVGFFPGWFRLLGESLPSGAVTFASQMFYGDFLHNLPRFACLQILWIATLSLALVKLNGRANQHLTVNGG